MAHLHKLVRAIPLLIPLAFLPACERQASTSGDPTIDGLTQTPMAEPDLTILGPQTGGGVTRRPTTPSAPVSAGTKTGVLPEAPGTPMSAPDVPPPPTKAASETPPPPPIGG